ncbi:MAG: DUF5689 domain-containing protein [Bacteroidales bacterium]|nr:DUF5689 domain-containing protein [Bacteroidales bacterium]
MKTISKLCLFAIAMLAFPACNDKFDNPNRYQPFDPTGKTIITIADLKKSLWTRDNFLTNVWVTTAIREGEYVTAYEEIAHASIILQDVYIQGRVISDDREGNFYRSLCIQDETTGITVKLGRNGLYNFYELGQTVYVKCQNLVLGFYRGMYELGAYPDEETYYATSYIDVPTLFSEHVFAGDPNDLQPIQPREISMSQMARNITYDIYGNAEIHFDSLRYDMLLGTLVKVVDLKHDSTDRFLGNLYPIYKDIVGSRARRTGMEIKPELQPKDVILTWALSAVDAQNLGSQKAIEADTSKVVFLRGNIPNQEVVTHALDVKGNSVLLFIPSTMALSVSHYYSQMGYRTPLVVRTSGYARFAGQLVPKDGNRDFVGIIGIYSDRRLRAGNMVRYPDFQLLLRDLNDVIIP